MKVGNYETGNVYYEDCLEAMKGLPDKSVDLCMTDPPFNVTIGKSYTRTVSRRNGTNKEIYYDDSMTYNNYIIFVKQLLDEINRCCKRFLVTPGEKNIYAWIKIMEPVGTLYHFKNNGNAPGTISRLMLSDPILVYGTWDRMQCFSRNVYNIPLRTKLEGIDHPCPKSYELWKALLHDYMHPVYGPLEVPNVVLDPFLGSGTTAELCESFSIPWIGFEKDVRFKHDIEKRIENGKRNKTNKQKKVI
jgi:site-specific DNA-methyltransferase (adenine-specific)